MTAHDIAGTLPGDTIQALLVAARDAATRAYVPYSGFPVGAAVLTEDGQVIQGANIENASYGLTVCGERVALQTAAAAGHRTIRAVAVSAPKLAGTTPCGACRQVMNEFKPTNDEMYVILDNADAVSVVTLSDLLPDSFGPRDLELAADASSPSD